MSDLLYKIAVTKIPGVGAITARQLIAWCGGVKEVFTTSKKDLLKIPGIGRAIVEPILTKDALRLAEKELIFIQENKISTYFYLDKDYPQRLTHFPDSPVLLYYKGNADLNHPRTVGIVGTRKPTEWGKTICEEIIEGLKPFDVQVVSGLAHGIDVTAHRKCIELNIPTIGCLGHGLHMVYPARHRKIAKEMEREGGLLTEFTSDEKPDGPHFPMRNRIIAGMSDALIVIETAMKGGSMITAEIANSYNKDVFAVPGRVKDSNSIGCNRLIKTHRANLLESTEDIGYIMHWDKGEIPDKNIQKQLFLELDEKQQKIVDVLKTQDSMPIDAISHRTGLSQGQLAAVLLDMEFKGLIKSLPGKRFVLLA